MVHIQGFNIIVHVQMHFNHRKQFNVTNLTSPRSDLKIFAECVGGPLNMLWRATYGPRTANCPPLLCCVANNVIVLLLYW